MHIALLVAVAQNNVIGIGPSALPWHLPKDMKYFKDTTMGHPMIMGRKTFEAFPKPLPKRLHIVISRTEKEYDNELVKSTTTLEAAIELARQTGTDRAFVIGGGEIFAQSLHLADELYITEVEGKPEGDVFFPEWDRNLFEAVSRTPVEADASHEYAFSFVIYRRKV